jgi:hypothetical protein
MISPGSLSAFSSPAAVGRSPGAGAAGAATGLERVRSAAPSQQGAQPQLNLAPSATQPQAGKILPRGSLLNLTI